MASPITKTIVLITGANKGIGFTVAQGILTQHSNYHVLLGSRSADRGSAAVSKLTSQNLSAELLVIDVDDDASIAAAAATVRNKYGRLDVLINNAANSIEYSSPGLSTRAIQQKTFETNLFGQISVTEAFLPLLEKSSAPRLVFQSSAMGTMANQSDPNARGHEVPAPVYRSAKAALNMWALHYAKIYRGDDKWKINVACPGYTATDLNGYQGTDSVEIGAKPAIRLATLGKDGESGTNWAVDGTFEGAIPW